MEFAIDIRNITTTDCIFNVGTTIITSGTACEEIDGVSSGNCQLGINTPGEYVMPDESPYVMPDVSLFGCYMAPRFFFLGVFYLPMGRISAVILPDGSIFRFCMARRSSFWMLYGAI